MRILNLGAGGFIGSHFTQRLLDEGHSVTAVDLCSDKIGESLRHPGLTFLQQDIRSQDWNFEALVEDADLVIDLVAYANPGLHQHPARSLPAEFSGEPEDCRGLRPSPQAVDPVFDVRG